MKVLALALLRSSYSKFDFVDFVDIAYDVSSFGWFARSTIMEYLKFACRTIADGALREDSVGVNLLVALSKEAETPSELSGYKAHCFLHHRAPSEANVEAKTIDARIMITDAEYPSYLAFALLRKATETKLSEQIIKFRLHTLFRRGSWKKSTRKLTR